MKIIQGTKPYGRQCNILLDAMVAIIKYNKITIDHDSYIKNFSYVTVYYLIVITDAVLKTTNNETAFPEIARVF